MYALCRPRSSFSANDVVTLNHRCNAQPLVVLPAVLLHTNHFSPSAYKHLGPLGNLRGQGERNIELGARLDPLIYGEINAACGYIASLPALISWGVLYRYANDYGKRKVVPACRSAFGHPLVLRPGNTMEELRKQQFECHKRATLSSIPTGDPLLRPGTCLCFSNIPDNPPKVNR